MESNMIRVLILKDLRTGRERHLITTSASVKIGDHNRNTMIIDIIGYAKWLCTQYSLSSPSLEPKLKALTHKALVWVAHRAGTS